MKNFQCTRILTQQDGSMMVVALMVMAILSIIGIHAISISSTEQQITVNAQTQQTAFYDADSGVQYTLGCIEGDLKDNTIDNDTVLPTSVGSTVAYAYGTPAGFSFLISTPGITMLSSDSGGDTFGFTSTGKAENAYVNAQSEINITFRRSVLTPFSFAGFGDKSMVVNNSGVTKSYDSESLDPAKNDPNDPSFITGSEADVGSNESLTTKNFALINGDGIIGEAIDGTPGVANIDVGTVFAGNGPDYQDRIDPDPLGINSGGEYDPTTYADSADNDNDLAGVGTDIDLGNGDIITLEGKSGGANYYFTNIILKNGATLDIDTTHGPVNIFIDGGELDAKYGSDINPNGSALDFAIYSNYESTASNPAIQFHNSSDFAGVVYAPNANILMNNSSDIYGAIWGSSIDIRNSGELFYDEALIRKYSIPTNDLSLFTWEEVQ
ncbi:MAG: pilus assembly PilX N-terminal domain-containing protein [Bacteroidales bacterium]|nr:pilus assembly PilX N-terminal domain-containing protein [Bacteroidales bacterium]